MAGTRVGGQRAAQTNKQRYGDNFYRVIGAAGGKKSTGGGFAANRELAARAGRKGGRTSRRYPQIDHVYTEMIKEVETPHPDDCGNPLCPFHGRSAQSELIEEADAHGLD